MSNQPLLIKSLITLYLTQKISVNFAIYFAVSSYLMNMLSFKIVLKYSKKYLNIKILLMACKWPKCFSNSLVGFFPREPMILLAVSYWDFPGLWNEKTSLCFPFFTDILYSFIHNLPTTMFSVLITGENRVIVRKILHNVFINKRIFTHAHM